MKHAKPVRLEAVANVMHNKNDFTTFSDFPATFENLLFNFPEFPATFEKLLFNLFRLPGNFWKVTF